MSFRREVNSHDAWQLWIEEQGHLLERAGIQRAVVATEARMREFLLNGRIATPEPSSPILSELTDEQFDHLLSFVLAVHPLSDDMGSFDAFEARRISHAP